MATQVDSTKGFGWKLCLAILVLPITVLVATIWGVNELVKNGYRKSATAVGAAGACATLVCVLWYAGARPSPGGSGDDDVRITSTRAWLSPDGTGGNCAWFDGPASSHGDNFVFCGYPAP